MSLVFVFGSNLAGRHGKGAALEAVNKWGAVYGQGVGRQGNSYAIPTKDENLESLSINKIRVYVSDFCFYAYNNKNDYFLITEVGTGLAGHPIRKIAPLFTDVPNNCFISKRFHDEILDIEIDNLRYELMD